MLPPSPTHCPDPACPLRANIIQEGVWRTNCWDSIVYRFPRTSGTRKPVPEDPFYTKWLYMKRLHRLIYIFYMPVLLLLLWVCALIMWLPWLCGVCTPSRYEDADGKKIKEKWDSKRKRGTRDIFASVGIRRGSL